MGNRLRSIYIYANNKQNYNCAKHHPHWRPELDAWCRADIIYEEYRESCSFEYDAKQRPVHGTLQGLHKCIYTPSIGGGGGEERHTNIRFDKTRRNQKRARPRGYGLHFLASYKTALLSSASLAQTILMARQSSTSILPRLLQIQWSLPAHMVLLSPFRWIEYDQISTVVHLRGFSSLSFFLFSLSLSNQPINPRKIETAYEFPSSSSSTCNRSKADRNKTQNIQTPMRLEHSSAVEASSITRISAISKRGQGFFTRRIFPLFFFKKKRVSALHTRNI